MNVQKLINTIKLKEYNGLDTEKEYAELIDIYATEAEYGKKSVRKAPIIFGMSRDSLEACRQMLPLYEIMLRRIKEMYEAFIVSPADSVKRDEFIRTFLAYDEVASLFADLMMEYAEGFAEESFPELVGSPFLSAEEKDHGNPTDNLNKVFAVINIACKYMSDAVSKGDKPKLLTLAALLFGTSHDILMVLRKIKEPATE